MKRRQLEFGDFEEVIADVEQLQRDGYERVRGAGLGQTCAELSAAIDDSMRETQQRDLWFYRVIARYCLRRALRQGRIPECFHASDDLDSHRPDEKYPDAIAEYKTMIQRLQNTYEFPPHPTYGKLPSETWEQIHLLHAAHELSYLVPTGS